MFTKMLSERTGTQIWKRDKLTSRRGQPRNRDRQFKTGTVPVNSGRMVTMINAQLILICVHICNNRFLAAILPTIALQRCISELGWPAEDKFNRQWNEPRLSGTRPTQYQWIQVVRHKTNSIPMNPSCQAQDQLNTNVPRLLGTRPTQYQCTQVVRHKTNSIPMNRLTALRKDPRY